MLIVLWKRALRNRALRKRAVAVEIGEASLRFPILEIAETLGRDCGACPRGEIRANFRHIRLQDRNSYLKGWGI